MNTPTKVWIILHHRLGRYSEVHSTWSTELAACQQISVLHALHGGQIIQDGHALAVDGDEELWKIQEDEVQV